MQGWIAFWKAVCIIGFVSFYILVLVIIPLGARDLRRLFRHLAREDRDPQGNAPE